ncbi:MAG: spermidine synthase [Candidatus Azotimanducaceae bacterium]|jgi:spermidine synthase
MDKKDFTLVAEETGEFGTLSVVDQDDIRYLRFDSAANQTMMSLSDPSILYSIPLGYTLAPLLWLTSPPLNILIAGAGGGDLIRFYKDRLPKVKLTAIERDVLVIKLAQQHFNLEKDDCDLIIGDAYAELKKLSLQNDIIVVDLHLLNGMPKFLEEALFYQHCYRNLSEEGILCLNVLPRDKEHLIKIMKIIRVVFNRRCLYAAIPNHDNITIYAFKHFPLINRSFDEITALSHNLSKTYNINFVSIWNEILTLNPILTRNGSLSDTPSMADILPN